MIICVAEKDSDPSDKFHDLHGTAFLPAETYGFKKRKIPLHCKQDKHVHQDGYDMPELMKLSL